MSNEALTVATPFNDVSELAHGFVERVGEGQLLIPATVMVAEGDAVPFVVSLVDGTTAFAGIGRCSQVMDRGEDVSEEEPRFELLLEELQFDEASQAVFDHLVAVRSSTASESESEAGEEAATDIDAVSDDDTDTDVGIETAGEMVEHAVEAIEDVEAVVNPFAADPGAARFLSRPVIVSPWQARTLSETEPQPPSGMFAFGAGQLPRPERPPRPELDPAMRVTPAPRPNGHAASEPVLEATPSDAPLEIDAIEDQAVVDGASLDGADADGAALDGAALDDGAPDDEARDSVDPELVEADALLEDGSEAEASEAYAEAEPARQQSE